MITRPRDTLVLARSLHSALLALCALPVACPLTRAPALGVSAAKTPLGVAAPHHEVGEHDSPVLGESGEVAPCGDGGFDFDVEVVPK
eukprot:scaffold2417_cov174-Isochrysis_galbana.AAC.1